MCLPAFWYPSHDRFDMMGAKFANTTTCVGGIWCFFLHICQSLNIFSSEPLKQNNQTCHENIGLRLCTHLLYEEKKKTSNIAGCYSPVKQKGLVNYWEIVCQKRFTVIAYLVPHPKDFPVILLKKVFSQFCLAIDKDFYPAIWWTRLLQLLLLQSCLPFSRNS